MASAGAIRAGRAFVELFTDDRKLSPGLRAATNKLQAFGSSASAIGQKLAGWGAGLLVALAGFATAAVTAGSAITDLAQRTGLSAEAASGLKFAAEQSATSIGSLELGMRKLQKTIAEASAGSKTAQAALKGIGLSAQDLAGLAPEEQLMRVADSIAAIQDPAAQTAAAMKIFGRSGAELIPLLEEGSIGIRAFMVEAAELGLVMSGQDAAAAEQLGDQIDALKGQLLAIAVSIGSALVPVLSQIAKELGPILKGIGEWVRQNPGVVEGTAKFAAGALGLGLALKAIGTAATLAAAGIKLASLALAAGPWGAVALAIVAATTALAAYVSKLGEAERKSEWIQKMKSRGVSDQMIADHLSGFDPSPRNAGALMPNQPVMPAAPDETPIQKFLRERKQSTEDPDFIRDFWSRKAGEDWLATDPAKPVKPDATTGFMNMFGQAKDFAGGFKGADFRGLLGATSGAGNGAATVGGLVDVFKDVGQTLLGGVTKGAGAGAGVTGALLAGIFKTLDKSSSAGQFGGALAGQSLGVASTDQAILGETKAQTLILRKIEKKTKPKEFV